MQEIGQILAAIAREGKLTEADKRWISEKIDQANKHERNMALLEALKNPDFYLLTMFLGGFTINQASVQYAKVMKTKEQKDDYAKAVEQAKGMLESFADIESFLIGGIAGYAVQEVVAAKMGDLFGGDKQPKSWVEFGNQAVQTYSLGISAFSASLLTLRAVFGNSTKDGGMASLAGLIA